MILCEIDIEENSQCKKCCKHCNNKCERKCVFCQTSLECDNKAYPIVGDYEVNPEIFDADILEIVKFSIEDEEGVQ